MTYERKRWIKWTSKLKTLALQKTQLKGKKSESPNFKIILWINSSEPRKAGQILTVTHYFSFLVFRFVISRSYNPRHMTQGRGGL